MRKNVISQVNQICTLAAAAMFLGLTLICFLQVLLRYCFNVAQEWPEEASRFLFIWIAYLGMAWSMYSRAHLKVDILFLLVSAGARKWIEALGYLVSLGFMALVAVEGWKMLDIVIESEETALTLPVPLWMVWFAIPFSFALTGLYCIINIYDVLTRAPESVRDERAREVAQ